MLRLFLFFCVALAIVRVAGLFVKVVVASETVVSTSLLFCSPIVVEVSEKSVATVLLAEESPCGCGTSAFTVLCLRASELLVIVVVATTRASDAYKNNMNIQRSEELYLQTLV